MKKKRRIIHTGFSLVMLILVVLIIVTFAALSMMSAQADYKLNEKLAQRTKRYYEVSNEANEIVEKIDEFLSNNYEKGIEKKEYYKKLLDFQYDEGNISIQINGDKISWSLPLNENQILTIELKILYPDEDHKTFYEITEWKTVQNGNWKKDESIPVLKKDKNSFFKTENRKK